MKSPFLLTILDGEAVNPGDLSYAPLEKFGKVVVYPNTPDDKIIERIGESSAILINKVPVTEKVLEACPNLKYIGVQATGYNVVDLKACKKHGVTVTNVPSYSTSGVAQLTLSFITAFASQTLVHNESVQKGDWVKSPNFCYWKKPVMELEEKTLGIFGYGNIGKRVAALAEAFGMKVIACTRTAREGMPPLVTFENLLKESDFVSLHAPLSESTKGIINKDSLALMKKSAYLINTARGAFVKEDELSEALCRGSIAGYAADVLTEEPMKKDNPLLKVPKDKIILTPHIAWAAVETRQRLLNIVISNLECYLSGKRQNVVSDCL